MYVDDCIHIEKTDQCYDCEHFAKGILCPLLEALASGVVDLNDEITVQNCGFYKPYQRHLSVVDSPPPAPAPPETVQDVEPTGDDPDQGGGDVIAFNK